MPWSLDDPVLERSLGESMADPEGKTWATLAPIPASSMRDNRNPPKSALFAEDQAEGLRRIFSPRPLRVVAFAQCGSGVGQTTGLLRIATQMQNSGDAVLLADEKNDANCLKAKLGVNPAPGKTAFSQGLHVYGCRPEGDVPNPVHLQMASDILLVDAAPRPFSLIKHAHAVVLTARVRSSTDLRSSYAMLKAASKANVPVGLMLPRQPHAMLCRSRSALETIAKEEFGVNLFWIGSFEDHPSLDWWSPNSPAGPASEDCRTGILALLRSTVGGRP